MGRIVPPFRQLYQETVSDLQMELKAALVDLGHKSAFDLLLKEAWNPAHAEITLFLASIMVAINIRKLISVFVRELQ